MHDLPIICCIQFNYLDPHGTDKNHEMFSSDMNRKRASLQLKVLHERKVVCKLQKLYPSSSFLIQDYSTSSSEFKFFE